MVKNIFRETVGIIHGRMNDKDIKKTMEEFKQKENDFNINNDDRSWN